MFCIIYVNKLKNLKQGINFTFLFTNLFKIFCTKIKNKFSKIYTTGTVKIADITTMGLFITN